MPFPIALAASLLPAAYQGIKGLVQKGQANNLQESKYIPPELLANKDLFTQQAFSKRAPGSANAESMARRSAANAIAAGQRSFGGDANKMAAVAGSATGQLNDANARITSQGEQFSNDAIGRLANTNTAIAGQQRQNRDEFNRAKEALKYSSDQNIFNSINNASSSLLTGYLNGDIGGGEGGGAQVPQNRPFGRAIGAVDNANAMPQQNPWADLMGARSGQSYGFDPYNWQQGQYQNGGVWRMPGYSGPQYNMNIAPRIRARVPFRK